ncbi:SEC12-like protein 2 [Platanthera guangdongensis]|uniref:SEC12-like protein 2 n=1 Tax=Platanthera guangdongensis TaxID=2320717 RepID=A0ABR2N551_9ASPA
MVKSPGEELRSKTYGLPLYCAAWVPLDQISSPPKAASSTANEAAEEREGGEKILPTTGVDVAGEVVADSPKSLPNGNQLLLALGGGGGEGRSGVPNAILLTLFDLDSKSLSVHPVHRVGTEGEVPYRMAMHPCGDGIVCSFPKSCRLFEWDISKSMEPSKVALKCSGITLKQLTDVGLQLALTFSSDGTSLATGGEDGHLRVFKWPSMDIFLDETYAHTTIKHLDFSSNGKYLVSIGERGCCKVWNLASSTTPLTLKIGDGFSFCRFSEDSDALYFTTIHGEIGKIISLKHPFV